MVIVFPIVIAAVPFITIWGWWRWAKRRQPRTFASDLSLIGFGLATLSALLALFTWVAAGVRGGFPYYDSLLLTIYRVGLLLAVGGVVFGFSGLWRPGPLRWHAPVCSVAMIVFWLLAAISE